MNIDRTDTFDTQFSKVTRNRDNVIDTSDLTLSLNSLTMNLICKNKKPHLNCDLNPLTLGL